MLTVRTAQQRGHTKYGWLDSHHTFSFADYYDPNHMGFRKLRVINEDRVAAGAGFPPHPHRDMEIISYVLEGAMEHKDSLGNGSVIRAGDVQRMTAGTGVTHSEFNASQDEPLHFLQIWIQPEMRGLAPGYEQKTYSDGERRNQLRLVASSDGAAGSVTIHQDARLYASLLAAGHRVEHVLEPGRHGWVQMIHGAMTVNGTPLQAGDAVSVSEESALSFVASDDSHFLVFDLA